MSGLGSMPMFANVVIADCEVLAEFQGGVVNNRLIVEPAEYDPLFIVAVIHLDPHPLTFACSVLGEFGLYVISR